ncbi:fas-binding factor 1 homolog [Rhynochetos jubatus]
MAPCPRPPPRPVCPLCRAPREGFQSPPHGWSRHRPWGSSACDVDPRALLQALKLASSANGRLSWEMRSRVLHPYDAAANLIPYRLAQLQAESLAPGLLRDRRPGAPAAQLCEDTSACQAALLSTQARVAELESQVRMLELERTQHKLLLESLQQRRQEELDLLESTHRSRMKVMEETYRQREQRLRQEKEQLAAQLLSQSQDAERARAELVARHQQHVATLEQQSRLELERLQELHRSLSSRPGSSACDVDPRALLQALKA